MPKPNISSLARSAMLKRRGSKAKKILMTRRAKKHSARKQS